VLVLVVLSTTTVGYPTGFGGLAVGLTLTMIHLATIPVDNTSVNPARSFGTAIFSGADAMKQLWVFIIFPLIGALLGMLIWLLVHETRLEDTMLNDRRLLSARDRVRSSTRHLDDRSR
jgi:aquaporin Z